MPFLRPIPLTPTQCQTVHEAVHAAATPGGMVLAPWGHRMHRHPLGMLGIQQFPHRPIQPPRFEWERIHQAQVITDGTVMAIRLQRWPGDRGMFTQTVDIIEAADLPFLTVPTPPSDQAWLDFSARLLADWSEDSRALRATLAPAEWPKWDALGRVVADRFSTWGMTPELLALREALLAGEGDALALLAPWTDPFEHPLAPSVRGPHRGSFR